MLTTENVNFCNPYEYSSSGVTGTTLTYHANSSNIANSGAAGITDIWYYSDVDSISKGTITCNLEGTTNNTSVRIYKSDGSSNSLLFDSSYQNIGATSFIVSNLNPEDHKKNHLYLEFLYQGVVKSKFYIQQTFVSGIYKFSFNYISRSYSGNKAYIIIKDISVERIRSFDNLYSTIANKATITVSDVSSSIIGLGNFTTNTSGGEAVTERRIVVKLMHGNTTLQTLLDKTFSNDEDEYEILSFTTPSEITVQERIRITSARTIDSSISASMDIVIPLHDGTNALLCPNCTYYVCFHHKLFRPATSTFSRSIETLDLLSISRYSFTEAIWQSIIEPIVVKRDATYIPAYNDIYTGTTGSTSGDPTQACLFREDIGGITGVNGCDIYFYNKSSGSISLSEQTYIRVKSVATQTYVVGQAVRACDLLNEADVYDPYTPSQGPTKI